MGGGGGGGSTFLSSRICTCSNVSIFQTVAVGIIKWCCFVFYNYNECAGYFSLAFQQNINEKQCTNSA